MLLPLLFLLDSLVLLVEVVAAEALALLFCILIFEFS